MCSSRADGPPRYLHNVTAVYNVNNILSHQSIIYVCSIRVHRDHVCSIRIRVGFEMKTHETFEVHARLLMNCRYILYSEVRTTKK